MKRILHIIAIIFILTSVISQYAYAKNNNLSEQHPPAVVDNAGFLTESQLAQLNQKLDAIREYYKTEVAIVTEETLSASNAQAAADDIYDYNYYGYGINDKGMLLYVCKNPRNYAFTTYPHTISAFNNNALIYLEDIILPHLKNDDYYKAFSLYADTAQKLLKMSESGNAYSASQDINATYNKTISIKTALILIILIPLILAFILTGIKLSKMKTAKKQHYASEYMKPGSMKLEMSRDIFMYSRTVRKEKPKSNTSSGGGHRSSSGRTHGGRSGAY